MAIEIVDLAIKNGWIFYSFVYVYQRVTLYVLYCQVVCHGLGSVYPLPTGSK